MVRLLRHKSVLVTRAAGQSSLFSDLLLEAGFSILEMPALEIRPPSSWGPLDQAIARLAQYDWLVLTSANAVTYFLDRLDQIGSATDLATIKLAVVGKKTARVLEKRGFTPNFVPPSFVADSLVADFPEPLQGLKLLFPRVESGGREVLVEKMTAAGAAVTEVAAYESGCPLEPDPAVMTYLKKYPPDVITFASSKTARYGCQLLQQGIGETWHQYLAPVAIAAIGPQTAATCQALIGRVDIQPDEYTLEGLTQAIVRWANASLG